MSIEELAKRVRQLNQDELGELVQRVPGLRQAVKAVERRQVAETRAGYRMEGAEQAQQEGGEMLTSEQRRGMTHHDVTREELVARYANPVQWTEHPWVVRVEGYQGGEPIILGTRIPVRVIAIASIRHGLPIWEILENWDVTETQVYDALSYYYDHREEIEDIIREQEDIAYWMQEYPPGKYEVA